MCFDSLHLDHKVTVFKLGLGNQDYLPKQMSTSSNYPMTEELGDRKQSF